MGGRDGRRDRALRRARQLQLQLGEELRSARLGAGLSQASVGAASRLSRAAVGRLERGDGSTLSLGDLLVVSSIVGLDASVRLYPGPRPLRDIGQVRLLDRFHTRIDPTLGWRTETPMAVDGDQRAWDVVISGPGWRIGGEAESRLGDLQALERRITLKQRDDQMPIVVLIVADTRHNRDALRAAGQSLASFGCPQRVILEALARGESPPASGIVVL